MDAIDLTLLQKRVETLIARFEIVGQDVAALRQRVEEVKAHVDLELESLRLHVDEQISGLVLKVDLHREATDAGFQSVLEALAARP
jgi:hypothetical protein